MSSLATLLSHAYNYNDDDNDRETTSPMMMIKKPVK
jgi:hypothetical protein